MMFKNRAGRIRLEYKRFCLIGKNRYHIIGCVNGSKIHVVYPSKTQSMKVFRSLMESMMQVERLEEEGIL